jgi:hypothetical protein
VSNKQFAALAILVAAYYYWTWKRRSGKRINVTTGRTAAAGKPTFSANTFRSSASTMPTSQTLSVAATTASSGRGTGFMLSPTRNIPNLNAPTRSTGIGTGGQRRFLSKRKYGFGTMGISPTWPTTQVLPTKSVRINTGAVQVPYYAAVPVVTRGPGGGGSVLYGGR